MEDFSNLTELHLKIFLKIQLKSSEVRKVYSNFLKSLKSSEKSNEITEVNQVQSSVDFTEFRRAYSDFTDLYFKDVFLKIKLKSSGVTEVSGSH